MPEEAVDAAEPETQKVLQDSTSLNKVVRNVSGFHSACPEIPIWFVTTITSRNVEKMVALVSLGLEIGVDRFMLREVFYLRDSTIVDHTKMPDLLLHDGDFERMKDCLVEKFETQATMLFADEKFLATANEMIASDMARLTDGAAAL